MQNNPYNNGYRGYQAGYQPPIPAQYRPISMWGYFGYQLLFAIPVIGFIALLVCAIGAKNHNVRNFARSYFCGIILILIIALIILLAGGGALFGSLFGSMLS